jgi:hypothetical protein
LENATIQETNIFEEKKDVLEVPEEKVTKA